MPHLRSLVCLAILAVLAAAAHGQGPPEEYVLYQNDPNPFCNAGGGYVTEFRFALPAASWITFQVLSPDTTLVVTDLVGESLPAGFHSILWDGRGNDGVLLPAGDYPYVMLAYPPTLPPAPDFVDTLVATIECGQPVDETTWCRVKRLFSGGS
jgi:hypothetical protein